ncbi:NAD(P)/FAD-dependent oxidoreductase [Actinoplanes sp. RD1]|uniref:NAD(P)/FAD-dependent oxidoreductase n=1 Tax=Actinoplanes sp. RD1 TaxID=3064538 RepID=UPI002741FA94|nr:FAD-dependent oxidoreductase [Actinoplanes sp. RD1]
MEVTVVGAGIVGCAVAYELGRAGAAVTVLERSSPGSGVTAQSFAWIGGPREGDPPDASTPLRRQVLPGWRRWERDVPGVRVRWHGALTWGGPLRGEVIGAARVRALEPRLRDVPGRAVHLADHGSVDPVAVTRALLRASGARVHERTAVSSLPAADMVVLAAGVDTARLCAPLGIDLPVRPSPAVLMRFAAPPGLVRTLVDSPGLEVRQAADGTLLVPTAVGADAEQVRRRLVAAFGTEDVRLLSARVGVRPMPVDGLPLIGPVAPGVYVAVMHSAITLAPAAAGLIAAEIVHGAQAPELAALRPGRAPVV